MAESNFFEDADPHIEHDGEIAYSVRFFVSDFVDSKAIFAYTEVSNDSDVELNYVFYAAFFGSDGKLVATSKHRTTLQPGVETQLGGMYSEIIEDGWKDVTSYKYTVLKLD